MAWRAMGVLRVPRRGLLRRCRRRRRWLWLGWRAALAALSRSSKALAAAIRTAPQPAASAFAEELSDAPGGGEAAVVQGGGYDSQGSECVYDPWSRTWGPADPEGLGWW